MKSTVLALSASARLPLGSRRGRTLGLLRVSDLRRNEVRDAVEAHRAAKREEVRREEAAAGRRLTAAELAELRQQVRQQWTPRQEIVHSAESQPAERMATTPFGDHQQVGGGAAQPAPLSDAPGGRDAFSFFFT